MCQTPSSRRSDSASSQHSVNHMVGARDRRWGHHQKAWRPKPIAKQVSKKAEAAIAPFQCALSTKPSCECVTHILQSMTDVCLSATVFSIDGVGACDLISKNAMLEGLLRMEESSTVMSTTVDRIDSHSRCAFLTSPDVAIPVGTGLCARSCSNASDTLANLSFSSLPTPPLIL